MKSNLVSATLLFIVIFALIAFSGRAIAQNWLGKGNQQGSIALIPVEGIITGSTGAGGLLSVESGASSVRIAELLDQAAGDPGVSAVVLRVNSPGGSAAASDEIYREIVKCRESKPVVVSMGDVAASGGYYISSAADFVYANGATLTGSIGVVFNMFNWEKLAENLGISDMTVAAGDFKDIGSPWRSMTDQEKAMLSELVEDVHGQFVAAVAEGRASMTEEEVRAIADGMIFTGTKAKEVGLVDEIGSLHDAAEKARSLAGVGPDVLLETYGSERSLLEELLSIKSDTPGLFASQLNSQNPLIILSRGMYLSGVVHRLQFN